MELHIYKRGNTPEEWAVELVDSDGDGSIELSLFSGPNPEDMAREYAEWKYQV